MLKGKYLETSTYGDATWLKIEKNNPKDIKDSKNTRSGIIIKIKKKSKY